MTWPFSMDLTNEPSATGEPEVQHSVSISYVVASFCPLCNAAYGAGGVIEHLRTGHPGWQQMDEDSPVLDGGDYPRKRAT